MFREFLSASDSETRRALERWRPLEFLGNAPKHIALFNDRSQRIVARGGRRWGKTRTMAARLIDHCLRFPGWRSTFFAKTETDALEIVWPDMELAIREYEVPCRRVRSVVRFFNGSFIRITGAKDQYEAQRRFRGRGWNEINGDEMQLLPYLKEMTDRAIAPATVRGGFNGVIVYGGTPGDVPGVGYWEEIPRGEHGKWSIHTGNIRDNPSINDVETVLANEAERLGGAHTQAFRIEWLGESAPPDESSGLVYRYNADVNDFEFLPGGERPVLVGEDRLPDFEKLAGRWMTALLLDLGHTRDASAILVLGATNAAPGKAWLMEEFLFPKRPLTSLMAAELRRRIQHYAPVSLLCDEGALGVQTADNLRASPHNIPITAADKYHPLAGSDKVNEALCAGKIMIPRKSRLAQDLAILRWDKRELEKGRRKMALEPHSDLEPLLRYSWPEFSQIVAMLRPPPPERTDVQLEADAEAAEVMRLRRQAGRARNRGLLRH